MTTQRGVIDQVRRSGQAGGKDPSPLRWTFYSTSSSSKSPVAKELEKLPHHARAGLTEAMRRYQLGQSRPGEVKSLGRGLLELRWRERNNHFRLIFKRVGSTLLALTAFYKNQEQTPQADIERAHDRLRGWEGTRLDPD